MAQNMKREARIENNPTVADVNIIPHLDVSHLDKKARPVSANSGNSPERIARPWPMKAVWEKFENIYQSTNLEPMNMQIHLVCHQGRSSPQGK